MALINPKDVYYIDYNGDGVNGMPTFHNWGETALVTMRDWSREDVYLIEFKRADAFSLISLADFIPAETLSAIRDLNSNTYLCLSNSHEGFNSAVEHVYVYVCERQGIPVEKCIFLSGGHNIAQEIEEYANAHNKPIMKAEWLISFEGTLRNYVHHMLGWNGNESYTEWGIGHAQQIGNDAQLNAKPWPITLTPPPYKRTFLCFNRRWRPHRPALVGLLCAEDMLKDGYVSLGKGDDPRCWDTEFQHVADFLRPNVSAYRSWTQNQEAIQGMGDLYLDTPDLITNRAEFELGPAYYYEHSLFSLVNETNFFCDHEAYEDMTFLSEKFFKPVAMQHPFLICSTPGIYRAIHELGYQTFPEFIPEDFDSITCDATRMWRIIEIVKDIIAWDDEKRREFVEYATPICEHNWHTLFHKDLVCHRMNY